MTWLLWQQWLSQIRFRPQAFLRANAYLLSIVFFPGTNSSEIRITTQYTHATKLLWECRYKMSTILFNHNVLTLRVTITTQSLRAMIKISNISSNPWYRSHLIRQWICWSIRCSRSMAHRRYFNYLFNELAKDNCKRKRQTCFTVLIHLTWCWKKWTKNYLYHNISVHLKIWLIHLIFRRVLG